MDRRIRSIGTPNDVIIGRRFADSVWRALTTTTTTNGDDKTLLCLITGGGDWRSERRSAVHVRRTDSASVVPAVAAGCRARPPHDPDDRVPGFPDRRFSLGNPAADAPSTVSRRSNHECDFLWIIFHALDTSIFFFISTVVCGSSKIFLEVREINEKKKKKKPYLWVPIKKNWHHRFYSYDFIEIRPYIILFH